MRSTITALKVYYMSREIIRQEIDQIMETIAEQWEIIRAYEDKIPFIEMDILMTNIRELYEDLYILDKMNKAPGFNPERIKSRIAGESLLVADPVAEPDPEPGESREKSIPENKPEPHQADFADPDQMVPEQKKPEPIFEPEAKPAEEQKPLPESSHEENIPEAFDEPIRKLAEEKEEKQDGFKDPEPVHTTNIDEISHSEPEILKAPTEKSEYKKSFPPPAPDLFGSQAPSLADKFQTEKKSIKDHLATNDNDNSLGNKMQQSQITDLKSAIGINDKFLFINELFRGDLAGYNRAIENLNICQSRQEALEKLEEMQRQFNWANQSASYLRLNDFLKRRHPH